VKLNGLACIEVIQSSRAEITKFGRHLYIAEPVENQPNIINAHFWRVESWYTNMYFTFVPSFSVRKLRRFQNGTSPPKFLSIWTFFRNYITFERNKKEQKWNTCVYTNYTLSKSAHKWCLDGSHPLPRYTGVDETSRFQPCLTAWPQYRPTRWDSHQLH